MIDTIFLGYVRPPMLDTVWALSAGLSSPGDVSVQDFTSLRVPDSGSWAETSHAFWMGEPRLVRYVGIGVIQPAGAPPLTAGVLVIGHSFVADLGPEWGSGRRPIDTGSVTPLASGGFAVVEGVRKRQFSWTFGDLSPEEADRLELIALALGGTAPALVIEDTTRSPGLRSRIHYGLFEKWRSFERRNHRQTRWEIGIEEWV